MYFRLPRPLLGAVFVAGLTALPNVAFAGNPGAAGRPAANPVQAVRALVHSYYFGARNQRMAVPARFASCSPTQLRVTTCPVTSRFLWRLQHPDPIPKGCFGSCTLD